MYYDRVEAETGSRKTVKNRLNGGSGDFSTRGRQVRRKSIRLEPSLMNVLPNAFRARQDDDKWEHDLFDDDKPLISNHRVDPRDLRLKLQKKHYGLQSGRGASLGVRDLREKLSGTNNPRPRNSNPPKSKREAARPAVKKVAGETKTDSNKTTKKKSQQADASVDSFLESLGVEKYSTVFQVEEVDMDALLHMTDDDLKAMLIPMGPRKKILLALGSKRG